MYHLAQASIKNADIVVSPDLSLFVQTNKFRRYFKKEVAEAMIKIGAKENLSNDFPLFRITDFYLIRAELKIRLGGNGDEEINLVRTRAGVGPWSGATLDQLLAERGRELFCEGHRRQDMIRFGKFGMAKWEKPSPDAAGKNIFPIPKWATDANPNLLINL
jgi:hypothetical protein